MSNNPAEEVFEVEHDEILDGLFQILLETTERTAELRQNQEAESDDTKGFEVTLICDGFIITGELISTKEFLAEFWEGRFLSVVKDDEESAEGETMEKDPFTFFHLKDAHIYGTLGDAAHGQPGVLWRGRVAAVTGFTMGRLSRTP